MFVKFGAGFRQLLLQHLEARLFRVVELGAAQFEIAQFVGDEPLLGRAQRGKRRRLVQRQVLPIERSVLAVPSPFANVDRQIVEATIEPLAGEKFEAPAGAPVTVSISPAAR